MDGCPSNHKGEIAMSKNVGLGVMLTELSGNRDSAELFQRSVGRKILDISLDEEKGLLLTLEGDIKVRISDHGQSCCEHRYMKTDDDIKAFIGSRLTGAEKKEAPSMTEGEDSSHDCEFLEVFTSKGSFTITNHNEHNGYYGGFSIRAAEEK